MKGCLDANAASAFVDRTLPPHELAAVEAHVSNCDDCRALLVEFVGIYGESESNRTTLAVADAEPPAPLDVGSLVGRYLVLNTIGRGGLGIVYAAYDPELDRKIALKLVRPDQQWAADELALGQRLMREARAMAKLAHPHVVTVHDVGMHADDVFIAMELVAGRTLHRWVSEAAPPWEQLRNTMVQAGHGLVAAHEAGLVHRDFKPANVLVGDDGRVRVLDFGLARALSNQDARQKKSEGSATRAIVFDQQLTGTGTVLGTPGYMAPEQMRGQPSDARADQFAFCVTMYRLLYGSLPFKAETMPELLATMERNAPAAPPPRTQVPRWLHRALLQGLSLSPDSRYESMHTLLAAITRDRKTRRRWTLAVVFGVVVGLAVWVGWSLRPQPQTPVPSEVEALAETAEAAAARAFFVYPPSDQPHHLTAYMGVVQLEHLDGESRQPGLARAAELRVEFGETLVRLGDEYWDRDGGRPFAADYYVAALLFVPDHPQAAERAVISAGALASLERRAQQGTFTPGELAAAEPLLVLADPNEPRRRKKIGGLVDKRDGRATALADLERLLATEQPDVPVSPPRRPPVVSSPAAPPSAGAPSRKTEDVGENDDELAIQNTQAGARALASRNFAAAERSFHQALRHRRRHPPALIGLSDAHFEQGAYQRSVEFGKKAVAAAPKKKAYRIKLGDAYLKVLRYDDAAEQYRQALRLKDPRAASRLENLSKRLGKPPPP